MRQIVVGCMTEKTHNNFVALTTSRKRWGVHPGHGILPTYRPQKRMVAIIVSLCEGPNCPESLLERPVFFQCASAKG